MATLRVCREARGVERDPYSIQRAALVRWCVALRADAGRLASVAIDMDQRPFASGFPGAVVAA
eukprot:11220482-Lingulodinium_polyedra.AAC.1